MFTLQSQCGVSAKALPEHLRDGKHEGIVEYDTQGPGQKVRTEFPRERPEQEET